MTTPTPQPPAPTPNVSETPRTDAVTEHPHNVDLDNMMAERLKEPQCLEVVPADFARQLERELAALTKERDILHDWKESALSILNEINFQEIGKALGLGLGLSVPKNILPGIRALQEKLAMATIERDEAKERAEQAAGETGNEIHALKGQLTAALARAEKAEEALRAICKHAQRYSGRLFPLETARKALAANAALTPTKEPTP